MAAVTPEQISNAATNFGELSLSKQVSILVGLAASIAIGVIVALWARSPELVPLYASVSGEEALSVVDALNKQDITHEYNATKGTIMVQPSQVNEARMQLAALGLPKGRGMGYELLDKPQGFGTSQFMESVRYRRGLEGELARTITGLSTVRNARVHLGIPKQSSFVKRTKPATASVMVELLNGATLNRSQVSGIVHLVSSSVPGIQRESVTVVDQMGNLLTTNSSDSPVGLALDQYNYTRQKEEDLAQNILDILTPIYGLHAVHAKVTAEIDYTFVEKTQENFESPNQVVRSEAIVSEDKSEVQIPEGIPGALSNQPPAPTVAQGGAGEGGGVTEDDEDAPPAEPEQKPVNIRSQTTRNYEVDKAITHIKQSIGKINKLSVAVVINDKVSYDEAGVPSYTPLTEQELSRVQSLVKDAVGYDDGRGDTVSVVNSSFALPPPIEALPATPFYQQPWFVVVVKYTLAGLLILLLIFKVIKPMMSGLITVKSSSRIADELEENMQQQEKATLELPAPDVNEQARIEHVKQLAHDDSKKAAQVVMNWVGREGE